MSARLIAACVTVVAAVALVVWTQLSRDAQRADVDSESAAMTQAVAPKGVPPAGAGQATGPAAPPPASSQPTEPSIALEQPEVTGLQLDARGRLVKNAQTRDELERILNGDPDALEIRRQEILATLPPAAAQETLELLERFTNYRVALRQALPDTALALTEQDALVMLDTVHALRLSYFGPQLTDAFFGAEEAIGRGTAKGLLEAGSGAR